MVKELSKGERAIAKKKGNTEYCYTVFNIEEDGVIANKEFNQRS